MYSTLQEAVDAGREALSDLRKSPEAVSSTKWPARRGPPSLREILERLMPMIIAMKKEGGYRYEDISNALAEKSLFIRPTTIMLYCSRYRRGRKNR